MRIAYSVSQSINQSINQSISQRYDERIAPLSYACIFIENYISLNDTLQYHTHTQIDLRFRLIQQ